MTTRTLELNLRARADTKGLESLIKGTEALSSAMRRTGAAFDEANADARRLVQAYGQLSQEEREQVASASRLAAAVSQAAAARERSAAAASNAAAAESRSLAAQQQAEGAALRTAAAQERLTAAQAGAATSVSRAAAAEEKLAQERQRTFQATAKSEKAELDVAKAREQLRAATARADAAEQKLTQTRKSSGLAADIVKQQFAALVTGGSILIAGRQLLEFGKSSISAASDAEEASAKFNQVFRNLAEGVRDDLEIMADANRRSIYDLVSFASTLQDTFVPLGFAREEAASLSTTITQLGIDIAAFSNKADSEVIDNLTSAIVGNHEAVRSYGIVLTETVLKQELARMGALELTGAALEVAKAQARVNIIMRSSADAQGAAVREAGSYANVLKAFDAATQELKVSIGEGLLPMMTQLVDIAIQAANVLSQQETRALKEANATALELADTHEKVMQLAQETRAQLDEELSASFRHGNIANPTVQALDAVAVKLAETSTTSQQFQGDVQALGLDMIALARIIRDLGGQTGGFDDYDERVAKVYRLAQARRDQAQALADLAEMEAAYEAKRSKIAAADEAFQMDNIAPAWVSDEKTQAAMDAWGAWAEDLGAVTEATKAAAAAQLEWNAAFGEAFDAAPVDDLIKAQGDLAAASGEWRTATIDNSREIADVQGQLAADLTRDQEAALRTQLKDLDDFSAEYMAIIRQLEGDLSDTQRLDLLDQLDELQGRQGQTVSAYTGDIEAAEEAQAAIIEANKAIQDSYYERAYNSIAARLIEEGNFAAMAEIAVGLGIMTQEEANLRLEYAQTTAAIDTLTASTAFYGLTAEQQTGAIKSLAAGIYDTADAALKAQENLKAASDFYSTAPDSTAISNYYTNLANQAAPDEGITTVVSVSIDPTAQREFTGFRDELEDYDSAIYETQIDANAQEAMDDFEKMGTQLDDLTRNAWVIKVRYETEGNAPATGGGGGGDSGGGGGGGPLPTNYQPNSTSPYVDLTVNNYAPGDVSRAVREGVLAAYRSIA
jgi:hypothetical protein